MGKMKQIEGIRFGNWTVIKFLNLSNHRKALWECICDCGNIGSVASRDLTSGKSTNCGCMRIKKLVEISTIHGESVSSGESKEYKAWKNIKNRCLNPKTPDYKFYGARGITICDRWKNSFENFLEDMGRAPSPLHTVERDDNDGMYEKGNCRWATRSEQSWNKRNTRKIKYNGIDMSLGALSKITNIPHKTLRQRILVYKWDIERALSQQLTIRNRTK